VTLKDLNMKDLNVYRLTLSALAIVALASPAFADDPICTDRPAKANATCTVPAGHWQVETDLGNYIRNTDGGVRTTTVYATNPTLKYGLSDRLDLQLNWAPYIEAKTHDLVTGATDKATGSGDLYLKLKAKAWSNDAISVSLIPFMKAPTAAHDLGNDKWEGGLAIASSFTLPAGFSMAWGPELDWLADADGSGRHASYVNVINISHPVGDKLVLAGEFWSQINDDPIGKITQTSADIAAAYQVTPTLQFDAGANFGLNRQTPDTQIYVGVSTRF
jgi:hypothetical protein